MIGLTRNERIPPQPVAVGADQAFSTRVFSVSSAISKLSLSSTNPGLPVIDLFGKDGFVGPVVNGQMIGELLEPTKQLLPRNGFSRCTLTGRYNAVPSSTSRLKLLSLISLAGFASSSVALTPVSPFSKKNFESSFT